MPTSFASTQFESDSRPLGNPLRFIQIETCSSMKNKVLSTAAKHAAAGFLEHVLSWSGTSSIKFRQIAGGAICIEVNLRPSEAPHSETDTGRRIAEIRSWP